MLLTGYDTVLLYKSLADNPSVVLPLRKCRVRAMGEWSVEISMENCPTKFYIRSESIQHWHDVLQKSLIKLGVVSPLSLKHLKRYIICVYFYIFTCVISFMFVCSIQV